MTAELNVGPAHHASTTPRSKSKSVRLLREDWDEIKAAALIHGCGVNDEVKARIHACALVEPGEPDLASLRASLASERGLREAAEARIADLLDAREVLKARVDELLDRAFKAEGELFTLRPAYDLALTELHEALGKVVALKQVVADLEDRLAGSGRVAKPNHGKEEELLADAIGALLEAKRMCGALNEDFSGDLSLPNGCSACRFDFDGNKAPTASLDAERRISELESELKTVEIRSRFLRRRAEAAEAAPEEAGLPIPGLGGGE